MTNQIGITERGDAALDTSWLSWVGEGKPAILISKDPLKLYGILTAQNWLFDPNIIVHCTITGYGGTWLEPNVPNYKDAMLGFFNLADKYPGRVVLRVDPIIPSKAGIEKAKEVILLGSCKHPRIRISFIDLYDHFIARLKDKFKDTVPEELNSFVSIDGWGDWNHCFHTPLEDRRKAWEELGKPEVCGEPGMTCTGCVSAKDCEILGVKPMILPQCPQRISCACLSNKHELLSNKKQCPNQCIYCYWRE